MSIPNLITLARLLSVPLIIWLVLMDAFKPGLAVFALAGLSDAIDGFVAKRWNQSSALGAMLDPVADKAMLVSLFITLGFMHHLPDWIVILVVFRDVLLVGGFLFGSALGQRIRPDPLIISKVNTAAQIGLILITLGKLAFNVADYRIGEALIYIVGATTVLSGAAYLVRWARSLASAEISP
ncbi:MAG TPA: CDP-alcohol phosphatidyltransferase family protein [Stellaceae bacterium]|nr:CDP-alcohol phosphatidyltransferase family protein [Stellaceae bacterium]